ncbi:carboxylate--amine ligase [Gudongella sp. DL1XJH-153]|uniref:carboxylate--amine ligase n=1 Tax=Gudongella sp. DL1XJH-153 TaxID=3409804 RepID=UPI003BB5F245
MGNKAVILGTNYYIGLSIIRTLGYEGVETIAVDYQDEELYGSKSKYLGSHVMAPDFKKDKEGYLDKLIEIAKAEEEKPVLFPSADPYAEFVDENLEELRKYYLIPMEEQGLWTKVMKKESLNEMASAHGLNVPETIMPQEENLYERVEEELGYPCIVKPTDSPSFVAVFRRKIFHCNNKKELEEALGKAQAENLEVFVQRIIPGFDDHMYTFDYYVDRNGKVTHWMTCRKLRQFPINFGASVYTEQIHVPELGEIGIPFVERIGYRGFGEIEFKKDAKTGKFYIIEINTRTTSLNELLYKAGINFTYVAYRDMVGDPLKPMAVEKSTGYVFQYLFEDILAIRDYVKKGQLSLGSVIKSLFRKKVPAVWSFDDPAPGLNYLSILLGKVKKKIFR